MPGDRAQAARRALLRVAAGCADFTGGEPLEPVARDELIAMLEEWRLAPLARQALCDAPPDRLVPLAAALDPLCRAHAVRWLAQQRELVALADLFAQEGLRFVALKGVALALRHYVRPVLRPMRDLDLLLSREDAVRAHALLQGMGYAMPPGIIAKPLDRSHQHPVLASPATGTLVELHHGLISQGWPQGDGLAAAMLDRPDAVDLAGRKLLVPHRDHLVLHLLAHATRNRPFDTGPQFLADLTQLGALRGAPPQGLAEHGLERAWALAHDLLARIRDGSAGSPSRDARADAALALMLLDDEDERERKLLMASGGETTSASWVLGKLVRPTPDALAQLSGRSAGDWRRWLAYPAWLASRTRRFLAARASDRLAEDVAAAETLRRWLTKG